MISLRKLVLFLVGAIAMMVPVHTKADQKTYNWPVTGVIDGDTLSVDASKDFILPIRIRVNGIDTPEKGSLAKCQEESQKALVAKIFVTRVISSAQKSKQQIVFRNIKWDKYGGRVIADVYIDGNLLSDMLVEKNLAIRYTGNKKSSWSK